MSETQDPKKETKKATMEDLMAKFDASEQRIAELELQLAQRGTVIGEAVEKSTPVIPAGLVKAQGKAYRWNLAHFVLPGTSAVYTAEEAATDPAIIEQILALPGQQVLVEQA